MNDKDLKKLRRIDLLELVHELRKENERLTVENAAMKAKLEDKRIVLSKAGSIADAALQLNGVFEAAQAACEQYQVSVRSQYDRLEQQLHARFKKMLEDAQKDLNEPGNYKL